MIGLSKIVADTTDGSIVIRKAYDSDIKELSIRVNSTKTLDGDVFIDYLGFSEGDRTFIIKAEITKDQETFILDVVKNETYIGISTVEGYFYGAIQQVILKNGDLSLTILIKEKLS